MHDALLLEYGDMERSRKKVNFGNYQAIVSFVNINNIHWKFLYISAADEKMHRVYLVDPSSNAAEEADSEAAAQKFRWQRPNMEFGTTEDEMAEERTAMALELLEASVFDAENNCSMCAKEESPGSALTDWIRCDSCNRWFHVPCVDMDKKQFEHARKAAWDCCLCKA
ncbi:hypothetical protein G5714_000381 [Onychostoma macrolepis]|uniref:PHD-type domain-containing protein n=1 Tax=Onychostoma macrolepis TaxID=369639 RepID=A0A7J6DGC6_9TELE|nr:hypothetical protein G5714_000381 [Onychostoma macrolepis]